MEKITMEKIVAELFIRDLPQSEREGFINTFLKMVDTSKKIIKIKESDEKLILYEDDSNIAI